MKSGRAKVSFIILTKNSMKTLPECMMSIKSQSVTKEIIVIDGGSTDGTWEYAKTHADEGIPDCDNLAMARNNGIFNAKGEYIAFVDSDVVLPRGWAINMLKLYEMYLKRADNVASVSCEFISIPRNKVTEATDKARRLQFSGTVLSKSGYLQSSIWKADFLKTIRANEEYATGGEDLDLFQKAVERGYTHLVTDQFNVKHYSPSRLSVLLKKYFRYGQIHWKIPSQKSSWNTYKHWYWPFTLLSWFFSPLIGGLPFWLIFLSPFIVYTWKLFSDVGEVQPSFTLINGLKFQAHSAGMLVGAGKDLLR